MGESEPGLVGSLEDLVLTSTTTGKDVMDRISEGEVSCVREALGEEIYGVLLVSPLLLATANPAAAAPVFGCLATESVLLLGVAFLDAQAGGWAEETRKCVTDVGREHPETIYLWFGLDWEGEETSSPSVTNEFSLLVYGCMTSREKMDFSLRLWAGLDRNAGITGGDIFAVLTESEAACVREALSEEQFAAVLEATPLEAVTIAAAASPCVSADTNASIFAVGIAGAIGGLSEESYSCVRDFAKKHPDYVALLGIGLEAMSAMDPDEFVAIIDPGQEQYDCLTEDEIGRLQQAATVATTQ